MRRVTGYKDYTTREGDTFDALALEMYGEEMLAHYIVEFNPDYADVLIFDANVALRLHMEPTDPDRRNRRRRGRLHGEAQSPRGRVLRLAGRIYKNAGGGSICVE